MKTRRSLSTTSFAGAVLAVMIATGAAPSVSCVACQVTNSYHQAVRVYDKARAWGTIVRWWVDPEYSAPQSRVSDDTRPSSKTEDICQAHPTDSQAR